MEEEIQKAETGAKKAWPFIMSWVGGITALIGLAASIGGGVTWFVNHQKQKAELQAKMALAQSEAKQGEYQASIESYGEILKADSLYRPALDQQLNTAMLWVEDFHVSARADQNAADLAAPSLDKIMAILDSGLNRSKGLQAADVQAHIGWAHWLNQQIAEREFGPVAEQDLRAALALDPSNVYANGMLGNLMLRSGGSLSEAMQHFNKALSTGKVRPFVRKLQLGGLVRLDENGARAEVVKTANDMRKAGESMDETYKTRILSFCFNPTVRDHEELTESLSAVPPDETWQTYLWIDDQSGDAQVQLMAHDFIQANLLELSGKREESLGKYRLLQEQLKNEPGTMKNSVNAAIARLSQS
jgi:tetratricopeptide (TPR) repeat protein